MKSKITATVIFVVLLATLAPVACDGGDPEKKNLPVHIESGIMTPETIEVKQHDMVTLKIQADQPGTFHLHTYDVEADVEAALDTDFFFVADATGRFKITYHPHGEGEHGEEEEGEIEIGFLEVQPR